MQQTPLSELGEFGLIKKLTENFKIQNTSTVKSIVDDAAVLDYKEKQIVVTTDLLVEGIHYNLAYVPLKHLGYKSVIVNLSDVYAMNAVPKQITVSLGISNKFYLEAVEDIYEGIRMACAKYGVDLIGGDTTSTVSGSFISITAIGEVNPEDIVYRNTAKEHDLICVSGDLGGAYAGLQLLEREQELFKSNPNLQPEFAGYEYIIGRQLKPEARKDIIETLKSFKLKPTAMIDISDGLSSELLHICSQSGTGCNIYEDKLPIANETKKFASELRIDHSIFAMNGGEDYELLFTISQKDFDIIKGHPDISVIGHITKQDSGLNLIARDGTAVKVEAQGWKNFSD